MKIYVHHPFSEDLFLRLFHNTQNKIYNIKESEGTVTFTYNNIQIESVWTYDLTDYKDGFHFISFSELFNSFFELTTDKRINYTEDLPLRGKTSQLTQLKTITIVLNQIDEWLKGKSNWFISLIWGENLFTLRDKNITNTIRNWTRHNLITELNPVEVNLPNNNFCLTNTLMFWNQRTDIMIYKDYGKLHNQIKHQYRYGYQIKRHRKRRLEIGEKLDKKLTHVSQTKWIDELIEIPENTYKKIKGAKDNDLVGKYDFDNRFKSYVKANKVGLDIFFLLYPKGEIQILNETLDSFFSGPFPITSLSEKTYGFLVGNIPFIPTHSFVLDFIKKCIYDKEYPIENEIKTSETNTTLLTSLIHSLTKEEREEIKKWTKTIHKKLIKRLKHENSLLEVLQNQNQKSNSMI